MLIKEKVNQAKEILNEFNIDCWITFVRESQINGDPMLAFLTEADVTWHSAFIINKDGSTHAIVGRYDKPAIEELGAYDKVVGFVEGIKTPFQEYMKEKNPGKIAINYSKGSEICDGLTYGMYLTLYELLAEIGLEDRLVSAERLVSALRERKSETEIKRIKKAVEITEKIWEAVSKFVKPGMMEKEIAEFMKAEAKRHEAGLAWDPSCCPAVFAGPDGAEAHYPPGENPVQPGHILNMDFGVSYKGYVSDTQRTFYILKENESEAPEDVMKGFNTIVKAVEESKQGIKIGIEAHEIDAIARKIVVDNGYEEFPHGLGHQLGRFSHDGTALLGPKWEKYAEKPFKKLEKNMVFTIEPRLTVPERGIATIEEMVVIKNNGAEWITTPQKEIILIK